MQNTLQESVTKLKFLKSVSKANSLKVLVLREISPLK